MLEANFDRYPYLRSFVIARFNSIMSDLVFDLGQHIYEVNHNNIS